MIYRGDIFAYGEIFTGLKYVQPSSGTTLMGEQPNPWDLLQPQVVVSRHRSSITRFFST